MAEGIGIDLGTSTSEIAWFNPDLYSQPQVISIDESTIVPSVVWFNDEAGRIIVGKDALGNQVRFPQRIISSVKRQIGKTEAELKDRHGDARLPVTFQGASYGPVEISAEILRHLAEGARRDDHPVRDVVVTVPAEFNLRQKEATVEAVRHAGLNLLMLLPEPVAALLAYADLDRELDQTVLVYDLGGGTLDCTIIRVAGRDNQVLAKTGGIDCAGDRIDQILFDEMLQRLRGELSIDLGEIADEAFALMARQVILTQCRILKERLSEADSASFEVSQVERGSGQAAFSFRTPVTRGEFEQMIASLVSASRVHIERALRDASLGTTEIDRVVMVGGSTRIPMVRRMVEEFFGRDRVMISPSPDLIVAQGAAIAAHSVQQGQPVVYDTLMHTLGMEEPGTMRFLPLIPRGTSIRQAERVLNGRWPTNQASVFLHIYEADEGAQRLDERAPDGSPRCRHVGSWEIAPTAPIPPGTPLAVTIAYDAHTSLPTLDAKVADRSLPMRRHRTPPAHVAALLETEAKPEIDLTFVIDTTGSMRYSSHWPRLKPGLLAAFEQMESSGADFRVGITTFGDLRGGNLREGDPLHLMDLTPRKRDFWQYVGRLDECRSEGGDDPESCLDAVWKSARNGLRTGENTLRAFVLITDASCPAPPVHLTPDHISGELRQRDITVYCISPHAREYVTLCEDTGGAWREIDNGELDEHLRTIIGAVKQRLTAKQAK